MAWFLQGAVTGLAISVPAQAPPHVQLSQFSRIIQTESLEKIFLDFGITLIYNKCQGDKNGRR